MQSQLKSMIISLDLAFEYNFVVEDSTKNKHNDHFFIFVCVKDQKIY